MPHHQALIKKIILKSLGGFVLLVLLGCGTQQASPTIIQVFEPWPKDTNRTKKTSDSNTTSTVPVVPTPSQIKKNFFKDILKQLSIQVFEHPRQIISINDKTFHIDATHTLSNGSKIGFGVLQRTSFYGSPQEGHVHSPDQYVAYVGIPTPLSTLREQFSTLHDLHIITDMQYDNFTYKNDRLSYRSKTKECIRNGSKIIDLPIYDEYFFVQGSLPLACDANGLLTTTEVPIRLNKQVNYFYVMMGGRKNAFGFKKAKPCEEENAYKVEATNSMIPQLSDCLADKLKLEL